MRVKRIILFILLIPLVMAAGGCGDPAAEEQARTEGPAAERPLRIAFSMAEGESTWSVKILDSMATAISVAGGELIYNEPDEATSQWQYENILTLLEQQIDYLILLPRDTAIVADVAARANELGVPVILITRSNENNELCAATISMDYVEEGRLCARELYRVYGDSPVNIVEILGPEDSSMAADRAAGFEEEISKYPNMTIVRSITGGFDQSAAASAMSRFISTNPPDTFNAVFACSDEDGLGALQALKLAGYMPGLDVSITSINGVQDAVKAIIASEYTASVESGRYVGQVVMTIIERLETGYDKSRYFVIPYRVFNSNTSRQNLLDALY